MVVEERCVKGHRMSADLGRSKGYIRRIKHMLSLKD
jgi:hypothetical protein